MVETSSEVVEQTVSDATVERLMRWILVAIAAAIVVALFAGGAVWALQGDAEGEAPMNAVDVGFLQDMIDHHEQAILISNTYLDERPDSGVAPYAREVIRYQEREIDRMTGWLADEGYTRGVPERMAMEWMDEPVPIAEMPGMQSQQRLEQLDAATGTTADRLFFVFMSDHHLGGIHMGDFQAANGSREAVTEFATAMARNQRIEIAEYQGAWDRLGL